MSDVATSPTGVEGRLPTVVVAGRPNVGKSTLVNRILGRRIAVVEEHPGVTRDRLEREADWRGRPFLLVDTGGVLEHGGALDDKVTEQALRAVEDADVVLLVTDARTGITIEDDAVVRLLRRRGEKVILVADKVDAASHEADAYAVGSLGFTGPVLVSAQHGRGVGDLLDLVVERIDAEASARAAEPDDDATTNEPLPLHSIAIVGRPNVGKSTLFNRLVGDDRTIVHDIAGTTRDAIDTLVDTSEGRIRFIDTAGLRRKVNAVVGAEYYSLVRSLDAIDRADIALLVLDATAGVTHQEQRLAERIDVAGSPIVIVLNKWELLNTEERLQIADDVADRLGFLGYAPVLRISAKTALGVHRILPTIGAALEAYHRRIPTSALNDALTAIQSAHPAPQARILYGVQGAVDPPTITLFTSKRLPPTYLRYVDRSIRERFELGPTALKLRVRQRGA